MKRSLIFLLLTGLLSFPSLVWANSLSGGLVITGNGPERVVMEDLARAFEKKYPGTYVDFIWNKYAKTLKLVKDQEADLAVAGTPEPDLTPHQIAWDGIAIMVSISNKIKDVTQQHIADLFSGKVRFWSDIGGPDSRVRLINRHPTQHLTVTFEEQLGIQGKIPTEAKVIGPEQKATNAVVGTIPPYSAVTYMSLTPALAAVKSGVNVRLLQIDKVEPELPTVRDGRYPFRRPVLLLTRKDLSPVVEAFIAFARSRDGQDIISTTYSPFDTKPSP